MILADTSAIIALLDADDRHHHAIKQEFDDDPGAWVLPWAILPEVDYLAATRLGPPVQMAFVADLASGAFRVEWSHERDIARAHDLARRHAALQIGLVDGVVMAMAERLRVSAIATLDLRHFGAVRLRVAPRLIPRDPA